jgi:ABC-type thiamine transport system substrate-binding protein
MHRMRAMDGRIVAGAALALMAAPAMAQRPALVYTALETDPDQGVRNSVQSGESNIDVKWVRDSTGVITAKLLAEKANPQADLVVGTSASSLAVLERGTAAVRAEGVSTRFPRNTRSAQSARMGRHGRLRCGHLLQHRRGREA